MSLINYARMIDALPNVANASDRDARFPHPDKYQKVWRIDTQEIEQWNGSAWVVAALPNLDLFIVTSYGAVGDGVTDDTAAIQAALDAIPSSGGILYFPVGVYLVSATLTIEKPGVVFFGAAGKSWRASSVAEGAPQTFGHAPVAIVGTTASMTVVECNGVGNLGVTIEQVGPVFENIAFFDNIGRLAATPASATMTMISLRLVNRWEIHNCSFNWAAIGVKGNKDDQDCAAWLIDHTDFNACLIGADLNTYSGTLTDAWFTRCAKGVHIARGGAETNGPGTIRITNSKFDMLNPVSNPSYAPSYGIHIEIAQVVHLDTLSFEENGNPTDPDAQAVVIDGLTATNRVTADNLLCQNVDYGIRAPVCGALFVTNFQFRTASAASTATAAMALANVPQVVIAGARAVSNTVVPLTLTTSVQALTAIGVRGNLVGTTTVTDAALSIWSNGVARTVYDTDGNLLTALTGTVDNDSSLIGSLKVRKAAAAAKFVASRANTSLTAPTALASGNLVYQVQLEGYDGDSYEDGGSLRGIAAGAWSNTSRATRWSVFVVPIGSTTQVESWRFDENGDLAAQSSSRRLILKGEQVAGTALTSASSPYTVLTTDNVLLCDATSGPITVNMLTAASGNTGLILRAIKTDSSANAVTLDPSGAQTINGVTTHTLTQQWAEVTLISDGANWQIWGGNTRSVSLSTPADPTGTTSATAVMMGLAGSITPKRTGTVTFTISGQMANNTINDGATVQLRTGTGSAPTNGAAATGTQRGASQTATSLVAASRSGFSITATVQGLTVGTAVWIDAGLLAVTGGTASIFGVTINAVEE